MTDHSEGYTGRGHLIWRNLIGRKLTLEWERRTAGVTEWELIKMPLPDSITTFEAQSMAAGLRAEERNIRDVRIRQTTEVSRYLVTGGD